MRSTLERKGEGSRFSPKAMAGGGVVSFVLGPDKRKRKKRANKGRRKMRYDEVTVRESDNMRSSKLENGRHGKCGGLPVKGLMPWGRAGCRCSAMRVVASLSFIHPFW